MLFEGLGNVRLPRMAREVEFLAFQSGKDLPRAPDYASGQPCQAGDLDSIALVGDPR